MDLLDRSSRRRDPDAARAPRASCYPANLSTVALHPLPRWLARRSTLSSEPWLRWAVRTAPPADILHASAAAAGSPEDLLLSLNPPPGLSGSARKRVREPDGCPSELRPDSDLSSSVAQYVHQSRRERPRLTASRCQPDRWTRRFSPPPVPCRIAPVCCHPDLNNSRLASRSCASGMRCAGVHVTPCACWNPPRPHAPGSDWLCRSVSAPVPCSALGWIACPMRASYSHSRNGCRAATVDTRLCLRHDGSANRCMFSRAKSQRSRITQCPALFADLKR
jgi:hypothetical protein